MNIDKLSRINDVKEQLTKLATRLGNNLDELKRPLVIEFTGTPKSGKTTCVDAIAKFFRRHEIPVHIVAERASTCPITDKHHLFFNIWTGATSLSQMLEAVERKVSVVILDRGVFDTLVWMDFLTTWQAVSPTELSSIESFFLLDRWTSRIDIVVALTVEPEVALKREFQDQITDIEGSIMNPKNLTSYNTSLVKCMQKYKNNFRRILQITTTDKQPVDGVAKIAFEVLSAADLLVDEQIAVVDNDLVSKRMPSNGVMIQENRIADFANELIKHTKWVRRTEAEENLSLVQIVPVATIRRDNEVLVMNIRGEKQGKRLLNRQSIWAGGHVRRSDFPKNAHKKTVFRRCLVRELDEELHMRLDFDSLPIQPKAIVWDNTAKKSVQHIGLFFEFNASSNMPKEVLHLREIWESPTKSLFTQFIPLNHSLTELSDWESWSVLFLREVYRIDFPKTEKQVLMF